jgi:hypothetical protein
MVGPLGNLLTLRAAAHLPRWLVLAGYLGGLVFLFTVTYVELLVLIFPAWVIAVSVVILRAGDRRVSGATS